MRRAFVHNKAVEVFQKIMGKVDTLKVSKRSTELSFKKDIRFLTKRIFANGIMKYIVFIVHKDDVDCCLASWEITAQFDGLNEELFYFIKSKMLIDNNTEWHISPFVMSPAIKCSYSEDFAKDLSFLKKKKLPVNYVMDGYLGKMPDTFTRSDKPDKPDIK